LIKKDLTDTYVVYIIDDPKPFTVNPREPYKTSTLQQDAINRLG
jgi:DNA topoisomerase-1